MASLAVSCGEDEEVSYTITKTATVDTAGDGIINGVDEIIEYTVEVENTGNTTITDVSVSDSLITLERQADDTGNNDENLDEGEIWVYTGSYTVLQSDLDARSIENTATVSSSELADKTATKEVTIGEIPFADDTVKIGVLLPLTGFSSMFGKAAQAAIEFVIDQMEAEGALNGADIEVIWADDEFNPDRAATEMRRLMDTEDVCAVIGPLGTGMSLGASPYSDTYEVPNLTIGGGGDLIDMGLSYWHAVTPERSTGDYGRTWVDFIQYCIENYDLPHDSIAVVSMDDSGGQRVRSAVLDRLEYYGLDGNVVSDVSIPLTTMAMDSYVLQCEAEHPDIHIMFAYATHSAMWVRAMDNNEYYPPFFIGTGEYAEYSFAQTFINSEIYNAVFNEEHNTPFATPVAYENIAIDSCREFTEEFSDWCDANGKKSYYSEWEPAVLAAQAVYALWDALEEAGESDPVKVNDALRNLSISEDSPHFVLPNAAPALEWESNGTMKNYSGFVCQIQDGVIRLVWPEDLRDAEPSLL